jgi:membrane-associated phospholipid phosphatase
MKHIVALAAMLTLTPGVLPCASAQFEPWVDAQHGAVNFATDAAHVYVGAPLRMGWRELAILGSVVAVGGVLYANDGEIYSKIQAHDEDDLYGVLIEVGEFFEPLGHMGKTNPYYFGALALGYTLDHGLGQHAVGGFLTTVSAELLQSHLTAGAFRQIGEIAVGRERPFETNDPYVFDDGTSFPSGHASVITEFATITSHHVRHPAYTALAHGIALAVCLQRIDSGNHWPSDVWAGAAYGAYASHTLVRRNDERRSRDRSVGGRRQDSGTRISWGPTREWNGFAVRARF